MKLIIGFGNSLRGDDGIGWHAARALADDMELDDDVEIIACHQLTPELAEPVSQSELVVFLDADARQSYGLHCAPVEPLHGLGSAFTHQLTPARLLGMAAGIFGSSPKSFELTAGATNFECSAECSPEAQELVAEMVSLTRCLVGVAKEEHHA